MIRSRGSNGQATGFVNGIAGIVKNDEGLTKRVSAAMSAQLEKNEKQLFPRVLLGHIQASVNDIDGVRKTVKPLCEKEEKTPEDAQALWSLASALTHDHKQPALACELLESVTDRKLWEQNSSGFQYSAPALLAYSLQKAGRLVEARSMLIETMRDEKVDEQRSRNNPGYGEYQYINSLSGLAERFLDMGYPAEAFIAYRKAYGDDELLEGLAISFDVVINSETGLTSSTLSLSTIQELTSLRLAFQTSPLL